MVLRFKSRYSCFNLFDLGIRASPKWGLNDRENNSVENNLGSK
jgi:hypothetical protein